MKIILVILCIGSSLKGKNQDISFGYWLPVKRLEQVDKLKNDKCDSANTYPFKKIKFFGDKKVSLFGFNAGDPSVCRISHLKEKNTWLVKDSILHTLYPEYVMGSKIILKIKNDTLYVYLSKNGITFFQKFIRKYGNVNLTDYKETELGNILLKGNYTNSEGDTLQIRDNGKTKLQSKKSSGAWNYVSYRFKYYAPGSCSGYETITRGIIELTNNKGLKEQYFIKGKVGGIDFYYIRKMNYWWDEAIIEFGFSLYSIK